MNDLKDKILDLDILDIIGHYVELKKTGTSYKGLSPFSNEKTPSFIVSQAKQIFKCFSSGIGGNAITFVMEHEKLSFWEACKKIAKDHNIQYEQRERTEDEKRADDKRESLEVVNSLASEYFRQNLKGDALQYVKKRWNEETIKLFDIGFAPDSWDGLLKFMKCKGVKTEILIEAGLIKENEEKKIYDRFRGRIMFPIHNRYSRITGFTGRTITDSEPKYLNTPETVLFNKSALLYGIDKAYKTIREKEFVYLVEGQPDVIRMHEIGIHNTVCTSGTSLTIEHIRQLKTLCGSVNIIPDTDEAGMKAMRRSAYMLIRKVMKVNVVLLPVNDKGEKNDPDSFFTDKEQFKEYVNPNIVDYIFYLGDTYKNKVKNPDFKLKAINEICELIECFKDPIIQDMYADKLGEIIPPKKAWKDKLKMLRDDHVKEEKADLIPKHVNANDFERYGFYEDKDGYHFRTNKGILHGCNFRMKPLFHIKSTINAKRLFEIENEYGLVEVIELAQKDLITLSAFRLRVESLGNFRFEASESEMNRLKRYLYENTDTCYEIAQLGWQKYGFFAWANGIYNGSFSHVDSHGIVINNDKKFYLPALSDIYEGEDTLFMSERRFIHMEKSDIKLNDYLERMIKVFGPNAKIAFVYMLATLYRDIIVRKFNFFPVLNLFGPKGAGKTELAVSIMSFFGRQGKGPNINNTSKPALADHVAQVCNACVHIDEYKNNIDFEKIEFLKGLWDGTGRTRMNMDKDKKKETTAVDAGVMLSGQEMPTADIALFSRLIYLTFHKIEYNDSEKKEFDQLKAIEKKGLTHLTNQLLNFRKLFLDDYNDAYDTTCGLLNKKLGEHIIEDRIFKNWASVLAAFVCVEDKITVSFTKEDLIKQAADQLIIQQRETRTGNEITTFWNIVQYLYADGEIQEECDFNIKFLTKIKTSEGDREFKEPKSIIFLQHSRIFPLYQKYGKSSGEKVLPKESIDFYLRNDKRFMGKKLSHSFRNINPRSGIPDETKPWKITTAYVFDYDRIHKEIGITLHADSINNDDLDLNTPLRKKIDELEKSELPF